MAADLVLRSSLPAPNLSSGDSTMPLSWVQCFCSLLTSLSVPLSIDPRLLIEA
ncbi:hypothetical protein Ancab_008175, partial [Ancistrocladus abbreviatus]